MQRIRSVSLTLILLLLFVGFAPTNAHATDDTKAPVWSKTLSDITPRKLEVSPSGSISGSTCDTSSTAAITLSQSDGATLTSVARNHSSTFRCIIEQAVDRNGTLYTIESNSMDGRDGSYQNAYLAAYKDNQQLWTRDFGVCQSTSPWSPPTTLQIVPQSLEIGYDGSPYVLTTTWDGGCTNPARTDQFTKIDGTTGAVKFAVPINGVGSDGAWRAQRMTAYKGGLAIADGTDIRHFGYDGSELSGIPATNYTNGVINHTVDANGNAFLTPSWLAPNTCPSITYAPGSSTGTASTFNISECVNMPTQIRALPNNTVAVEHYDSQYDQGNYHVKMYESDGTPGFSYNVSSGAIGSGPYNAQVTYDSAGKTLVTQVQSDGKLRLRLLGTDGTEVESFTADGITLSANRLGPVAISNGYAYVTICSASCWYNQSAQGSVLYKFAVTELSSDYPRGELQDNPGNLYVALGDSFSSGEGAEDFDVNTAKGDVNECHRSEFGYSRILAYSHPSLNLALADFVACSGATTSNILSTGQWNEARQIDALTSETDKVSLTIGGNDVGFSDYILSCVAFYCGSGSPTYAAIMDAIASPAFKSNLKYTYEEVLEKAENADVYVMDYPYIIANNPHNCAVGIYTPGTRDVQVALNTIVQQAVGEVAATNPRLHLVMTNYAGSPFEGHSLCDPSGETAFFNPLVYNNTSYSFHPNAYGQGAYATVLKDFLED